MLIDVDVPNNIMQGALVSTRRCWENAEPLKVFSKLVGAGCHVGLSSVVCLMFNRDLSGDKYKRGVWRSHTVFDPTDFKEDGLLDFASGVVNKGLLMGSYRSTNTYRQVSTLAIGRGHGNMFDRKFFDMLELMSAKVKSTNPFAKASNVSTFSINAIIETTKKYWESLNE